MARTKQEFDDALQAFFDGCKALAEAHRAQHYPNNPPPEWRLDWLKKSVRVVKEGSAHCFVDMASGDVLKSAGWGRPAKHARGNIFDAKNGLGAMGPHGPAYLR